jgi:CDGSH-type Zn-finger protein
MPRESQPTIKTYRGGPFLVRGPMALIDEDGRELQVRREVMALCRCGRSRTKPLCDGAHGAGSGPAANGNVDSAPSPQSPPCADDRPCI